MGGLLDDWEDAPAPTKRQTKPKLMIPDQFITKDTGARQQFDSGMQRDSQEGKPRYDLALDGPLARDLLLTVTESSKHSLIISMLDWYLGIGGADPTQIIHLLAAHEGGFAALFKRYVELMARGAVKYTARNWMQAEGEAELERFKASAVRHFIQWLFGDRDEDHAAAVWFNLNGAAYVQEKMNGRQKAA